MFEFFSSLNPVNLKLIWFEFIAFITPVSMTIDPASAALIASIQLEGKTCLLEKLHNTLYAILENHLSLSPIDESK